jgi:DNA polymerase-3 subunit alpha
MISLFTHLHTHSWFSFLSGLASPQALAQAAAQDGMAALALTDHASLAGAIVFYDACLAVGVRPILGLELQLAAPLDLPATSQAAGALVLLAQERAGWASLCRLSSAAHAGPAGEAALAPDPLAAGALTLPFEHLAQDTAGLLCLSGGTGGLAARLVMARQEAAAQAYLARLGELFPDRLYVELTLEDPAKTALVARLAAVARALRLPIVAAQPVYYLSPAQAGLQRLASAIRLNRLVADLPPEAAAPPGAHFTTQAEMEARFAALPQALAATQEIAERCRLELPLGKPQYPELDLPAGQTADQVLRRQAFAGALRLYAGGGGAPTWAGGDYTLAAGEGAAGEGAAGEGAAGEGAAGEGAAGGLPSAVNDRLEHELGVIGALGYAPLFLVMEEIVNFARRQGIPISSRGSAASSLVAHCLGISSPDPLRLNLYFERFLNPARASPPDIDTDLCSRRRDEVIHFVYRRFGAGQVAMVCTISRFRRRSALRATAKALGFAEAEIKALTEGLPWRGWGPPDAGENLSADPTDVRHSPFAGLVQRFSAPAHLDLFRQAAALIGLPDHLSVHPGGVVITPGPLTDLAPTLLAPKGLLITQFDLESIARLGLVKIDLLGIRGLTVLGEVAEKAGHQANTYDFFAAIAQDDASTAELVRNGRTMGCFQIESPGMRATLKEIQARSVDDLMVALALYRPGPLTGGLKDAFVRRHRGQEPVTHIHPALVQLLDDTHGVILYQEQVLRIAHELAGLSLADADLLRRAMSHFDPGEQMKSLKARFIAGARQLQGMPETTGERVWEMMAAFAGYGFPKAHAASYALVSWQIAWCKAHHPALFMAAVLANWGGYYSQRNYLAEARRMGLGVRPPHVNHARREFSVVFLDTQPVLFMGLDQVKDLTHRTQARIQRLRPFHSLIDFLARVDPRPVEAENLALAGALAGFGTIPQLLRQIRAGGWRGGQLPLFSLNSAADLEVEDWSLAERVAAQEAVLGVGVDAHPLELQADKIAAFGALTTDHAASQVGQRVRLAGMRQSWHRTSVGPGAHTYLMACEDLVGMLDVVLSDAIYHRYRPALAGPGPYVVEGLVERDRLSGEPFIRCERLFSVLD